MCVRNTFHSFVIEVNTVLPHLARQSVSSVLREVMKMDFIIERSGQKMKKTKGYKFFFQRHDLCR